MNIKKRQISFFLLALVLVLWVPTVFGHSFVIDESPSANSQLSTSPEEVKISFNSKVEKNFTIIVKNEKQEEISTHSLQISESQKEISVQLPTLEGGKYQVEYYVISSNDGHPIQGSYSFLVKMNETVPDPSDEMEKPSVGAQETLQEPNENEKSTQQNQTISEPEQPAKLSLSELVIYLIRAVYYFSLVLLIGWIIWWRIIQNYSKGVQSKYLNHGIFIQMLHLVSLISVILMQLNIFSSYGIAVSADIPLHSNFGLLWFISLLLSLVGFVFLFKYQWFDLLWIFLIVLCKSLNGHALEFEPAFLLVLSDSIHLIAASIWAAGLTFTICYWRKQRLYVSSFLPIFSEYAFISIIALTITGGYLSFIYLDTYQLLLTAWGTVLLIKLVLVLLIVGIGAKIRSKMRNKSTVDLRKWLIFDFSLLILILIVVSILTHLNPMP